MAGFSAIVIRGQELTGNRYGQLLAFPRGEQFRLGKACKNPRGIAEAAAWLLHIHLHGFLPAEAIPCVKNCTGKLHSPLRLLRTAECDSKRGIAQPIAEWK